MADEDPRPDDEPVPRLPRGKGWGFSRGELVRIGMIAALLVAVVALRQPCSQSVGTFIQSFEPPIDAGVAPPQQLPPLQADEVYVHCGPEVTPEECARKIERAQRGDTEPPPDAAAVKAPGGSDKASAPAPRPGAPDRSPR